MFISCKIKTLNFTRALIGTFGRYSHWKPLTWFTCNDNNMFTLKALLCWRSNFHLSTCVFYYFNAFFLCFSPENDWHSAAVFSTNLYCEATTLLLKSVNLKCSRSKACHHSVHRQQGKNTHANNETKSSKIKLNK